MLPSDTPPLVVRAAISLPDHPVGDVFEANPDSPYVAACLESGYLVLEREQEREA